MVAGMTHFILSAILAWALMASPAASQTVITDDPGGPLPYRLIYLAKLGLTP